MSWRGSPPSARMTHTSVRPLRSDWNAIRVPSGEKNGPASIASPGVSAFSLPLATSTVKMAGLPRLEEKNAMRAESGDQLGWKSPPGPVVTWRVAPSFKEWIQMFISPPRSELKATDAPSGDHAPRLSSRVVLMTASGAPVGSPVCGETGSFQISAFWRSVVKASCFPSAEMAGSTSCPAPDVTCWSVPARAPSGPTGARQMFHPPPRSEVK